MSTAIQVIQKDKKYQSVQLLLVWLVYILSTVKLTLVPWRWTAIEWYLPSLTCWLVALNCSTGRHLTSYTMATWPLTCSKTPILHSGLIQIGQFQGNNRISRAMRRACNGWAYTVLYLWAFMRSSFPALMTVHMFDEGLHTIKAARYDKRTTNNISDA